MRIAEIHGDGTATGDIDGTLHRVDLSLVDATEGDYVIVHAGFAIENLDEAEANERLRLFRELAEAWEDLAPPRRDTHPTPDDS